MRNHSSLLSHSILSVGQNAVQLDGPIRPGLLMPLVIIIRPSLSLSLSLPFPLLLSSFHPSLCFHRHRLRLRLCLLLLCSAHLSVFLFGLPDLSSVSLRGMFSPNPPKAESESMSMLSSDPPLPLRNPLSLSPYIMLSPILLGSKQDWQLSIHCVPSRQKTLKTTLTNAALFSDLY